MIFSLSTHWNAHRHTSGEELIQEILGLGFSHVELGYDLRLDLVPGVLQMVNSGAVTVTSTHNFCPVPTGAPAGHPELFSLCSSSSRIWQAAQRYTSESIEFAAQVKARTVVVHAGRVQMTHFTARLLTLADSGKRYHPKFDRVKDKLFLKRDKKASEYVDLLYAALEQLLPVLEKHDVRLGIENLPSWEAVPTETEMQGILTHFDSPHISYWHDIGHARVRQNLGFANHLNVLDKLSPRMSGMHVHDVAATAYDHLMPPRGDIDFGHFRRFIKPDTVLVLEPAPGTPSDDIVVGRKALEEVWGVDEET